MYDDDVPWYERQEKPVTVPGIIEEHFGIVGLVIYAILVLLAVAACTVLAMMAWF